MLLSCSGAIYWSYVMEPAQKANNQAKSQAQKQGTDSLPYLLPSLRNNSDDLQAVIITTGDGIFFSAEKSALGWQATHLDTVMRHPVDANKLGLALERLAQAKIAEKKTSREKYYHRLGVENISLQGASSRQFTLQFGSSEWSVLIGNTSEQSGGSFARLSENPQSVLLDQNIPLPDSQFDWLSPDILPFSENELVEVEIDYGTNPPLVFERGVGDEDAMGAWQWRQQGERELIYANVIKDKVSALVQINYTAVQPYVSQWWGEQKLVGDVIFTLADTTKIYAYIAEIPETDEYLIWFSTPDKPYWSSDWVYTLDNFSAKPFLLESGALVAE